MTLKTNSKLRKNFGVSNGELALAKSYLQGAVYCWVKNRESEIFAVRDLFGGTNFDWHGTPLFCFYQKHIDIGKDNESAIEEAGKDVGWLLKTVLNDDKRTFDTLKAGHSNGYKWVGNEA